MVKFIKGSNSNQYIIIGIQDNGTRVYYNAQEDHFNTDANDATVYDEKIIALDDWNMITNNGKKLPSGLKRVFIQVYDKILSSTANGNKKLSRAEFIDTVLSKGYIALDNKQYTLYYVVTEVNDTNFDDMSTKLRDQLETEGLYDNSYIGFLSYSSNPPYTVQMLPIYGNPNKYVTRWFTDSAKQAIEQDLKDRQIGLLSRANKYINDI